MPSYQTPDPQAFTRGFNNMVQLGQQRREFDAQQEQRGLDNQERNRLAQLQGDQLGMQKERLGLEQQDAKMKGQEWLGTYAARAKASGNIQNARGIMREALQIAAPAKLAEFDAQPDEALIQQIEQFAAFAPPGDGNKIGAFQPGDYEPQSVAKFQQSGNPADLVRYNAPQRDFSPNFQNVTRTHPDGSTEMGAFNTRTSEYQWSGQRVPAGTKARVDAQGRSEGDAAGDRAATQVTNSRAYETFRTAMQNLEGALAQTETGPVAGRIPAVTSAQQTAEGAIAVITPTLKQLFRSAGEGTFTDRDQQILIDMVPKRTDHPEARAAKLQMIDSVVRAKLGMPAAGGEQLGGGGGGAQQTAAQPPRSGASQGQPVQVRNAQEAASLPSGTVFITPDGRRKVRP